MCLQLLSTSIVGVLSEPSVELDGAGLLVSSHSESDHEFSHLVVHHDDGEEGEGWDGEVGEWDGSGEEDSVQEWHVQEGGDEGGLEEQSEVSVDVSHSLLGDGKVSGLANHQVRPLHAHNGHEVSGLSVLEGFSGVANLGWLVSVWVGDDGRKSVEGWDALILWIPSASRPGLWGDIVSSVVHVEFDFTLDDSVGVEKSDVNESSSGQVPGQDSTLIDVKVVTVSESFYRWVVLIIGIWEESLLQVEEPDGVW